MSFDLGRRKALALPLAALAAPLAAPRIARAAETEITVHYAQPFIYKDSYDAIMAEFAKREPGIKANDARVRESRERAAVAA